MSLSKCKTMYPGTAVGVFTAIALAFWGVWKAREKRRSAQLSRKNQLLHRGATGKILDLRDEASFGLARIRGSYNIPVHSLWGDNRWYELPEQREPLLVLLPPCPEEGHANLAEEIIRRRAEGATTTLMADHALMCLAKESGLLEQGPLGEGDARATATLFTPSPFLVRAAAAMEPHLIHACLPMTCIDVGCGAGRDAVWLARRGWTVTAVDCWNQALQKTAQLANRMGVSERVEVLRGKVKNTGDIHLSALPLVSDALIAGHEGNARDSSGLRKRIDGDEERIIRHSTPASEYGTYALVVVIRFLERNAFDTLVRLVDPRGGYLLLSTFIEEERETLAVRGAVGNDRLHRRRGCREEERYVGDRRNEDSTSRRSARCANSAFLNVITRGEGETENAFASNNCRKAETGDGTVVAGGSACATRGDHDTDNATIDFKVNNADIEKVPTLAGAAVAPAETRSSSGRGSVGPDDDRFGHASSAAVTHAQRLLARRGRVSSARGGERAGAGTEPKNKRRPAAAVLEAAQAATTMARWPHDSPRDPKKILRRGELARYFGDRHGFEVLEDSVERLPDGRPVACFLARRLPVLVS